MTANGHHQPALTATAAVTLANAADMATFPARAHDRWAISDLYLTAGLAEVSGPGPTWHLPERWPEPPARSHVILVRAAQLPAPATAMGNAVVSHSEPRQARGPT